MTARRGVARSVVVFVSSLGLFACEGASAPLARGLRIDPSTIELGRVALGDRRRGTVVLTNDGDDVIRLGALDRISGLDRDVAFVLSARELPVGGSVSLFVDFAPTTPGLVDGVLGFAVDGEAELRRVPVRGEGVVPAIAVAPSRVELGRVVPGVSATTSIVVTNASADRAVVSVDDASAVRSCVEGGAVCVDGASDVALAPGATMTLSIVFAPTSRDVGPSGAGAIRRTLVLSTCALPECRVEVALEGEALVSGLECPSVVDFGLSGATGCAAERVTCVNVASHDLGVARWRFEPGASAAFELAEPTPATLAAGASIDVDVTYCPTSFGRDEATLVVEATLGLDASITVHGDGLGPDLVATPSVVDFGLVSLIAPARRTVRVENLSDRARTIVDVSSSGPFSMLGAVSVVPARGAVELVVEAQPFVAGVVTGELVVRTDAVEPLLSIALRAEGVDVPPCALEVPAELELGAVPLGRTARAALALRNAGAADCILNDVTLDPASSAALSIGAPPPQRLAPGATAFVDVSFHARAPGPIAGTIEITASTPQRPFVDVAITGLGVDVSSAVFPEQVDFGARAVACAAPVRTIWVLAGERPVEVTSITLPPGAFTLEGVPALPRTLSPGQHLSVDVTYTPGAEARETSTVVVETREDAVSITRRVLVEGRGASDGLAREVFPPATGAKVDALFLVLDSACHAEEHARLAANAGVFLGVADALAVDYQVATTTLDLWPGAAAGRLVPMNDRPTIVTPTSADPADELAATFALGIDGSPTAEGFDAARLALAGPHARGHNAGFLRDDAALALVYVVDREDARADDVELYVDLLRSLKGPAGHRHVRVSAISGGVTGCSSAFGAAYTSASYHAFAARMAGVDESICAIDWVPVIESIGRATFGAGGRFVLASDADPASVRVFVDGVEVASQGAGASPTWTYDVATRTVSFAPLSVPVGAVELEYRPTCRE
ncbi:choice-of-anchor D domain-containing protein [Myxococcota bacterium]|nr:choice-of-anchor D domain-containing protein [Myxococcota bacterium]